MGSDFEITLVAENQQKAAQGFELAIREIQRIEKLISSWSDLSQTSEINRNAGIKAVKVDQELWHLIERSIAISKITDGAFDITYAAMDELWNFNSETLPPKENIEAALDKVGFEKVKLNKAKSTVFLPKVGMKIGFGAIGKGYAADRAKVLLLKDGFKAGIINASGDMNVWGTKPNGENWLVAIKNPMNKAKSFALMPIKNRAVVTSGDYEKFIEINGRRYSHIIDPRSGYPGEGIISVTVFAPKAELADALATAVFVMGIETALNRINQLDEVECLIIDTEGGIHQSKGVGINTEK